MADRPPAQRPDGFGPRRKGRPHIRILIWVRPGNNFCTQRPDRRIAGLANARDRPGRDTGWRRRPAGRAARAELRETCEHPSGSVRSRARRNRGSKNQLDVVRQTSLHSSTGDGIARLIEAPHSIHGSPLEVKRAIEALAIFNPPRAARSCAGVPPRSHTGPQASAAVAAFRTPGRFRYWYCASARPG